jgi:uncharacterized ion transporter superfamily protein YfcC
MMRKILKVPHALVIMFMIAALVSIMSYFVPAGSFQRIASEVNGRLIVVPGTFEYIQSSPIGFIDFITAFPRGFKAASEIIYVVLSGGVMFALMERTKALENGVGVFVRTLGIKRKRLIVIVLTLVYGFLGIAVGYENNIALVPIAAMVSLAIGGDLLLAAGISVGAMTVGFGLSPINPYTVGLGQKLAEIPLFSGSLLRSILCLSSLAIMCFYNVRYLNKLETIDASKRNIDENLKGLNLSGDLSAYELKPKHWLVLFTFFIGLAIVIYGVFNLNWFFLELSGMFLCIGLFAGIIGKLNPDEISASVLDGVKVTAAGAFMVGFAASIKVLLEDASLIDTLCFYSSSMLSELPKNVSLLLMMLSQSLTNFLIPSGSGQALATLPLMLPLGELIGVNGQLTVLAFQIGDGLTNLINPTLGGLIAMLSLCRVSFDRWVKFIFPLTGVLLALSLIFLLFASFINYS